MTKSSAFVTNSFQSKSTLKSKRYAEPPQGWQEQVLSKLSTILDPDLGMDIVSLNFVKNLEFSEKSNELTFEIELTTPACPIKQEFEDEARALVMDLDFVDSAQIRMTAQEVAVRETEASGLNKVANIIAVSSCKGGVGKSTTSVNLAFALSQLGAKVGIFDVDVYGPSLPTMVSPDSENIEFVGTQIAPLRHGDVKLMSFGFVNEGSAIMRGPMVTQLLDQFLGLTHWGELDYLVLDMPPGTGDIQLTLSQKLNMTAAVIVTTPQELSFVDVERGIEMFDSVNVPCVAVVENMAYYEQHVVVDSDDDNDENGNDGTLFEGEGKDHLTNEIMECLKISQKINEEENDSDDDENKEAAIARKIVDLVNNNYKEYGNIKKPEIQLEKVRLFGPGHKQRLANQWGIENTFSMPLLPKIAENGDKGIPFIEESPDSTHAMTYLQLAGAVVSEVAKINYKKKNKHPVVSYDEEANEIILCREEEAEHEEVIRIQPKILRAECKCASCVEEMTGRQLLVKSAVSNLVRPRNLSPTGNYATSIDWSDGHRSLYPHKQIMNLMEEVKANPSQFQDEESSVFG